jgi:hypothetical protein
MNKEQLDERLQQLHDELQTVESADAHNQELLKKLRADIRALLDAQEGDRTQHYGSFGEQLREGITRFEASHPNLTLTMGQLAEMLAKMGI